MSRSVSKTGRNGVGSTCGTYLVASVMRAIKSGFVTSGKSPNIASATVDTVSAITRLLGKNTPVFRS